jgi:hypothetical protein
MYSLAATELDTICQSSWNSYVTFLKAYEACLEFSSLEATAFAYFGNVNA